MKTYMREDFIKRMDAVFQKYEEKTAIVDYLSEKYAERYTYGQLREMTTQVGEALAAQGIGKTERVAVLARPSAQSAMMLLALSYLGYVAVLPDISLPVEEQNKLLRYVEPSAVVIAEERYALLDRELRASVPVFSLISDQMDFGLLNPERKEREKTVEHGDENVMAIIFSSGDVACKKGSEITYQAMMHSADTAATHAAYDDHSRFLHVLPQTQDAGYTMLFINFQLGSEMAFVPEFSAEDLMMGLRTYEPTHLVMIPKSYDAIRKKMEEEISKRSRGVRMLYASCRGVTSYLRRHTGYQMKLLMRPFYASEFGRNIHVLGCGTAPCSMETVQFFQDMGISFPNAYGSAEESFPVHCGISTREWYPDQGAEFGL